MAADAVERRVLAVTEGREAKTIAAIAAELTQHGCPPEQIESVSIDMSPAFIKGCTEELPNARITFDKFHVVWHANAAVDKMRRIEQRSDKSLKGLRWSLLKDRASLKPEAAADLDALIARMTTVRTARAWVYKEQLREILERKQINVVRAMLLHWCTCVMRSKVEPMKDVAALVRRHLEGIVAWAQTRQTNGFLEALNGLFQAAKRRARGFTALRHDQDRDLPDRRQARLRHASTLMPGNPLKFQQSLIKRAGVTCLRVPLHSECRRGRHHSMGDQILAPL